MKMLLPSGIYHGIATHDPAMLAATKEFAAANGIRAGQFEFQMLYGIRTDLQDQLVREGFRLRVYIPFGQDWFPYFMRRLAERPSERILHFEESVPAVITVTFSIRLPKDIERRLDELAKRTGRTKSSYIWELIVSNFEDLESTSSRSIPTRARPSWPAPITP